MNLGTQKGAWHGRTTDRHRTNIEFRAHLHNSPFGAIKLLFRTSHWLTLIWFFQMILCGIRRSVWRQDAPPSRWRWICRMRRVEIHENYSAGWDRPLNFTADLLSANSWFLYSDLSDLILIDLFSFWMILFDFDRFWFRFYFGPNRCFRKNLAAWMGSSANNCCSVIFLGHLIWFTDPNLRRFWMLSPLVLDYTRRARVAPKRLFVSGEPNHASWWVTYFDVVYQIWIQNPTNYFATNLLISGRSSVTQSGRRQTRRRRTDTVRTHEHRFFWPSLHKKPLRGKSL